MKNLFFKLTFVFEMAPIRNIFLLSRMGHNEIDGNCFCVDCRERRIAIMRNHHNNHLYDLFINNLPSKERSCLDKLFANTLNQIVVGKVYKESSLQNSGYRYFKSWAKNEAAFAQFTPKRLTNFCEKVNEAFNVFHNWDTIVLNLTDSRMSEIDARRFSVRQFYLAKSIDWCLNYNEMVRKKNKRSDEPLYPAEKYDAIFQNIVASGILEDIQNNPTIASAIGARLQTDIVRYCRLRYHPY